MNTMKLDYEKYLIQLEKLVDLHAKIKDIDISLSRLHPVAIIENDTFLVFDFNEESNRYYFVKKYPTPMPIPKGVKAAFELQEYDNKIAAILSADTFDSMEGYVFTFHEFVNCYQHMYDSKLKAGLGVYHEAMKTNDYMWEINYAFPYEDSTFSYETEKLGMYFDSDNADEIKNYYSYMKDYLEEFDYEYLIWQQWKEGYARYIENSVRQMVELDKNHQEASRPFNRVSFYEIGSRYIDFILRMETEKIDNIETLFYRMLQGGYNEK